MNKRGLMTLLFVFAGLFLLFFGFSIMMLSAGDGFGDSENKIGVVEVSGPIMKSKKAVEAIEKFVDDESIKGLVIRIDSPGGAVAPSQEIFHAVKKAKEKKPLAVSMGSTAASGGYYIACGADTIFANAGSVTGSISVISQVMNFERLLDKAKIDVTVLKTGAYKDTGSMFREFNERDRVYFEALIGDIYEQFVEDVATSRKLDKKVVKPLADGRVFTGRQALKHKLVDKIGSLNDAAEFVSKEAKAEGKLKLIYPPKDELGFLSKAIQGSFDHILGQSLKAVSSSAKAQSTPVVEYRWSGF